MPPDRREGTVTVGHPSVPVGRRSSVRSEDLPTSCVRLSFEFSGIPIIALSSNLALGVDLKDRRPVKGERVAVDGEVVDPFDEHDGALREEVENLRPIVRKSSELAI